MSIQNYKKSIFSYNKSNELITYVDLFDDGELRSYYNLENNVLTKQNIVYYKENNKSYKDIKRAIITFREDCKLFHIFLDGDSCCKAIKLNSLRLESPEAESKVYFHNGDLMDGCTISQNLVQDWIKKL